MRSKFYIAVLLITFLLCGKNAYAIFDPMATVESALELKDEIVTQVQEVQKFISDTQKRIKQGYAMATSCFKNPLNCGLKAATSLITDGKDGYKTIKMFPMMDGAVALLDKDLTKVKSEDVSNIVKETYIYHDQKESLSKLRENRDQINSVVANQSAILFAKGAMMKTRLKNEESAEIYEDPSEKKQDDSIQYLQGKLDITNATRLARIVELKAYMLHAQATSELTQQSIKDDEEKD